jgi:hypothetical protein
MIKSEYLDGYKLLAGARRMSGAAVTMALEV